MTDDDDESIPLYEALFSILHQLCREYPALSPFDLEEKSYHSVIKLFADTRKLQIRQKILTDPNRVIRKKAKDDWF